MILLPLHCDSPIEITSIRSMWNHILQVAFSCLRSWPVSVFLNASDQGSAGIGMASSRIYSNSSSARMHILHRTLCLASGKGVCLRGPSARHTKCLIFLHLALPHQSPGYWGAITTAQRDRWGLITPAFSTKSWSLQLNWYTH